MTKIFGEDTELQSRGANINITPPRRASVGNSSAANVALALEGVADILGSLPKPDKVGKIAESLDRKVREIEVDTTMNSFQKAERKSMLLNSALARVGTEGKGLIQTVFDNARTKQEVNAVTGEVQFLNVGTGEVTRLNTDTPEGLKVEALQESSKVIDEFFPTVSDEVDRVLTNQIADNVDPISKEGSIEGVMSVFTDVANRLNNVHNRSKLAIGLPADQQDRLIEFADREYSQAGVDLLNHFYDDIYIDSLKGEGGMTPEDFMVLVNSAERDFMSEVTTSGVPNDIPKLKTMMRNMKNDLQEYANNLADKDINTLNRSRDKLKAKNEITKETFMSNNPDLLRLEAIKEAADTALDTVLMTRELQGLQGRMGDATSNAAVSKLLRGSVRLSGGIADTYQTAIQGLASTKNELDMVVTGLQNPQSDIELLGTVTTLSNLMNDPYSIYQNEDLKDLAKELLPSAADKAIEEGWIDENMKTKWLQQLGVLTSKNDAKLRQAGIDPNDFKSRVSKSLIELQEYLGGVIRGRGNIEKAELTRDGKLKEPEPVQITTPEGKDVDEGDLADRIAERLLKEGN